MSVLKYALYDESQGEITTDDDANVVTASNTEQSYSDLRPYCDTNEIYLAEDEEVANTIINGTNQWW